MHEVSGRMTHVSPNSGSLASPGCVRLLNPVEYNRYEPCSNSNKLICRAFGSAVNHINTVGMCPPATPGTHDGHGETGVHVYHARDKCALNHVQNRRCRHFVSDGKSGWVAQLSASVTCETWGFRLRSWLPLARSYVPCFIWFTTFLQASVSHIHV